MNELIMLTNVKNCDLLTVSGPVFLLEFNFFSITSHVCYAMQ